MELLFSYSHVDEDLRNKLEVHLAMLQRQGLISAWHDRRITAGSELHSTINAHIESAEIILLLVSPDFLASNYCYEIEMNRAMERHAAGEAKVIPVILRPCDWVHPPLDRLRATPRDGKPVVKYSNIDDAFLEVVQDIRGAIAELTATGRHVTARSSTPSPASDLPRGQSPGRSSNLRIKRSFNDHERDQFLEQSFEYIANYFEGSIGELKSRNPQVEVRFRRVDANHFTAAVYLNGRKESSCRLWLGGNFGGHAIYYSSSDEGRDNSFNEQMSVDDDGYNLVLSPLGMLSFARGKEKESGLTQEGAAEHFWSALVDRLQR